MWHSGVAKLFPPGPKTSEPETGMPSFAAGALLMRARKRPSLRLMFRTKDAVIAGLETLAFFACSTRRFFHRGSAPYRTRARCRLRAVAHAAGKCHCARIVVTLASSANTPMSIPIAAAGDACAYAGFVFIRWSIATDKRRTTDADRLTSRILVISSSRCLERMQHINSPPPRNPACANRSFCNNVLD